VCVLGGGDGECVLECVSELLVCVFAEDPNMSVRTRKQSSTDNVNVFVAASSTVWCVRADIIVAVVINCVSCSCVHLASTCINMRLPRLSVCTHSMVAVCVGDFTTVPCVCVHSSSTNVCANFWDKRLCVAVSAVMMR
jgi:hypothetical protein